MPGYGYAKLSREVSSQWPSFIEPYLNDRPTLALCLALVDVNVPPQAADRQLVEFLASSGRPFVVVATKSDRLSPELVDQRDGQHRYGLGQFLRQADAVDARPEARGLGVQVDLQRDRRYTCVTTRSP